LHAGERRYSPRRQKRARRRPIPPLAGLSETPERSVAERPLNTTNLITLISVAILVGTELIALALAAGWALAGLFELGRVVEYVLMGSFTALAMYGLYRFMQRAASIEPIR